MSFPEEEQQPGPALEQGPEPRLLTRPDRQSPERQAPQGRVRQDTRVASPVHRRPRKHGAKATKRRAARLRLWARAVGGFALLLVVVAAGLVLYLRHAIGSALPQIDGAEKAAGLQAPVTVTRDTQGVPTISAANLPDLLFAQGYTTAADRLWQMDALRRHAAGELAEILGPGLVEHDRRQRYLQIRAAADRAVAQLPADQLAQLEAYARGVNAYIDAHGDALPPEFRLLAYKPARWTPRDSLLVSLAMWQDLSTEFPRTMDREALSAHLPTDLLADLYPVGSWRDQPPASQGRDLTAPHAVEQIPLDPSQSRLRVPATRVAPGDLLAVSAALAGTGRCEGCRSGSNNWAVSGARTASGAPLLANDMHLSLAIPDIWYEASLHADLGGKAAVRMDVTGFTLPGVPFVIVGRNARVAWGVTNLGADVQDLRVEHLRGTGDGTEFEKADGTWAPVTHHGETIRVRGGLNVTVDVETTVHALGPVAMETPVISALYKGEGRALSLAWTAYDPAAVTSPFLGVNTAADGASLVAALAHFGGPSLNLVWADADGHIGYHAIGMIPVRGPAVQHPRAVTAPVVAPGAAVPDEDPEGAGGPEALVSERPQFVLSAYRPVRRGVMRERSAVAPVRAGRRGARAVPRDRRAVEAPEEAPLPVTPTVDYTMGSAIAPGVVDALDASQTWSGYVPYGALPAVVDPKNGFLATANARVTADDSPYALALDWADPFRVERIVHMLAGSKGLTAADMLRMETDAQSDVNQVLAQRLAYAVDHASAKALSSDGARLHEAANLLRGWDGEMAVGSASAAIVTAVRQALWPALLVPQIEAHDGTDAQTAASLAALYTWGEKTTALELLVQHEPARWLPKGFANWDDFLAVTMASALKEAHAPGNLARWQYGAMHRVEIAHPVFGTHPLLARLLGVRATTGAQPAPGDATTVDAIGTHFGPSERFVADLSTADGGLGNVTTGESANPRSPWYLNEFRAWLEGRSYALPGAGTEAAHTLTLQP